MIDRDLLNLHPRAQASFRALEKRLQDAFVNGDTKTWFRLFEGYRSPQRQNLLANGTKPVTKAQPWASAHQFGLAADFVPWDPDRPGHWHWSDDADWPLLKREANRLGLVNNISWDKVHVEHPLFQYVRDQLRFGQ